MIHMSSNNPARSPVRVVALALAACVFFGLPGGTAHAAEGEITAQSRAASDAGLRWLAENQGAAGNWGCNDLGLVSLGVLAFLSDGHMPGRGLYGDNVKRGLDYIVSNAKPSGLLNISNERRDMYNHGLATFVLTQAYGMSNDPELGRVLDRALQLISDVQAADGGWDYIARRQDRGHDLSLAVMQAKALRGAMDVGMEVPPRTVELAIQSVRRHYKVIGNPDGKGNRYGKDPLADRPGVFTYDGNRVTTAMGAAGAVCLQEFGEYEDFRIYRSADYVLEQVQKESKGWKQRDGKVPLDAYTLYYVAQALFQVGGERWEEGFPLLRDGLVARQRLGGGRNDDGSWDAGAHVGGRDGRLFGTATAVFVLNIPNRYLPILQPADASQTGETQADRGETGGTGGTGVTADADGAGETGGEDA